MKGYRLEDMETEKLITSCNVHFIEDDSPDDLVEISTSETVLTQ